MDKTERTPTPWPEVKYDNDTGPSDECYMEWWSIPGVADFDREADAEFARMAVNAHEALVEACQEALALLDKQRDEYNSALTVMPRPLAERGPIAEQLAAALAQCRQKGTP